MEDKTGGQAFPSAAFGPSGLVHHTGMDLLDYFAGQALIGMVQTVDLGKPESVDTICLAISKISYRVARAMIAERSKNE